MVVTNASISDIKAEIQNYFSTTYSDIAVGQNGDQPVPADTSMDDEVLRKALEESTATGAGSYIFAIRLSLTQGNGYTLTQVAVFDQASGGQMGVYTSLSNDIDKTIDKEVYIEVQIETIIKNAS